ncbi:MAG TPA: twin-arginine translocation signal domain-containing protein [Casimicrobiaceae bacterium]|nr:twin-arginine translocation signal domain-containing protein [Casimicrobiaceae bacterium]
MERRAFLKSCALAGTAGAITAAAGAWAQSPARTYARVQLVDVHGAPLKAQALAAETNYVFNYPYASTPCFLLNLGRPITTPADLRREDGARYAWQGGVGRDRSIVAFSAICAHKLAYPTRDISFIRYQARPSPTSDARVIHCCADHSVYDPAGGARVVSGPAPQPLAAVLLEHDAATDQLVAIGTQGAEQFEPFFRKYEFRLAMEYGQHARDLVRERSVVRELTQYCRQTIEC